jgi:DNA-binding transcriptional LysR family regulator
MLEEPDLVMLARVIDRGSFARAAAELNVPPSTLSRRVAALEDRLGVRALERTTRRLRATEIGELLAARGRRVRAELEDAERVVADHRSTPRGLLRLAIPTPASDFLGPVFADMLARYPELRFEVAVSDSPLELLAVGFDAALHGGTVRAASTYGVTRVGHIAPVLAASPRYLERVPEIRHPRDLADPVHTIIARSRRSKWQFVHAKAGNALTITPAAPRALVTAKSLGAELVVAGVGVALIPRTAALAHPELRILEPGGYRPAGGTFALVTPSARTSAPKVRAFADAMKAFVATRPDLFT